MLHVLNGDATRAVVERAGLPGDVVVWRDILVEGPVTADDAPVPALEARRAFLAGRLAIDPDAYARAAREQAAALEGAGRHDEVVLWFEQDLFCAVNLWRLLDWFARRPAPPRLSLVYPAIEDGTGLGGLAPGSLPALFAERTPVTSDTLALGQRAWAAYASADPLDGERLVDRDEDALPFVRDAFRCHRGRFPSVANGLNEVEAATLTALGGGPRDFHGLFREVSAHPRVRPHGMGDLQFAATVRRLAPLVRVPGGDVRDAQVEITHRGREVAAGTTDWLSVRPIDTWLGGVHLAPGRPLWRWDGPRDRLVASGS